MLAGEAVAQVAVVPLHMSQKCEFLQEELVTHKALEGLSVVGCSKMDLKGTEEFIKSVIQTKLKAEPMNES